MLRQSEEKKQKRVGEFYCLDFTNIQILALRMCVLVVREIL
jgi:hypothetical protein